MGCVYQATNLINGKRYIGKTVQCLDARCNKHTRDAKHGSRNYFHRALLKYGLQSFAWDVIYRSDVEDDLFAMEKEFIQLLGTKTPNGYNLTDGGEGMSGAVYSDETRAKISAANKGRQLTAEQREKFEAGIKRRQRRPLSEEQRKRQSERTRETNRRRVYKKGYHHTAAARAKMSDAHKGKKRGPLSQQWKMAISKSHLGKKCRPMSEAQKQKLSVMKKGKPAPWTILTNKSRAGRKMPQEFCNAISKRLKGRVFSEAWRKKLSQSSKARYLREHAIKEQVNG